MSETLEPWQWPEETWRHHVSRVRAGRPLRREWPGGARVAVLISFDADHETPALRDGITTPGVLSGGEYGARVGVPRILSVLRDLEVPASFFVPAVSALLHPAQIDSYVQDGHEIAVHGWIHERNTLLAREDERELTARSLDTLERLSGRRPVGIRTPSWDFSPDTLSIIRELGFLYDSSLMADDDPYELVEAGEPTGIVEIPVEWIRDDAPYFGMARYAAIRPHTTPGGVLEIWKAEFEGALASGGVFQLTAHPSLIGHHSRIALLRALLEHIIGTGAAWFATHEQLARHVLGGTASTEPAAEPVHTEAVHA